MSSNGQATQRDRTAEYVEEFNQLRTDRKECHKFLKLAGTIVHGKQEPGTRLCKVRFMGRHWVRVLAHVRQGFVEVASCLLFPQGGEWREAESYVLG